VTTTDQPVALLTGAAARLGAASATALHARGYRILIHYHRSRDNADALCTSLNTRRPDSALALQADLDDMAAVASLADQALSAFGRVDVLINNASAFYPTPIGTATQHQWDALFASNARAPLFLINALAGELRMRRGCIINMTDLYASRGLNHHSLYTMAKTALEGMTRTLARELAPDVRVNAVAPGAILWPPGEEPSEEKQQAIIDMSALKRMGSPEDIANAVAFLVCDASYVTGQVLHVDGGR
jgi:pteridine reductase